MNKYEALYIINPDLEETAKAFVEKFNGVITTNGGTIDSCDEWGKRRLAYPINFKSDGYFVLVKFTGPSALPLELERNFKITDGILRYLVTRLEA